MTEPELSGRVSTGTADVNSTDLRDPSVLLSLFIATIFGSYLLLTSTTNLIPGIWLYDAKRILQFGLLLLLFLVPALSARVRMEFGDQLGATPNWIKVTLLGVFCWGMLSALINAQSLMHALNSLSEVALLLVLVLGVFVVAACRRIAGHAFDRIAIGLLALTGLAVGLQELIGVAAAHNAGVEFNFRISLLHFSWPRFYNQFQSWAVPALVALPILFPRYRLVLLLCALVLGLQWYIILMTGARGSFVSLGGAFLFALVFLPPIRSYLLKWQLTGLALGTVIFAIVLFSFETGGPNIAESTGPESAQPVMGRGADSSISGGRLTAGESSFFQQSLGRSMGHTSGRTWMWSISLRDSRDNPLLGIGPMNYVCVSHELIGHPHNFPLQLAAEWGVPVAVAVCVLFGFVLWRAIQGIRRFSPGSLEKTRIAGLLLTGVVAAALHACLSGVMVMPASQTTGLLLGGLLLGLFPREPEEQAVEKLRWVFIPGLVLTVALLVLGAHELDTMKDRASFLKAGDDMWPRVWQDSKVCRLYNEPIEVKN